MKKIPAINYVYWLLIISANTLGETAGDFISQTLHLGYDGGTLMLIFLFCTAVIFSLFTTRLQAVLYWCCIVLASTTGTTISDWMSRILCVKVLHVTEDTAYVYTSLILILLLVLFFWLWRRYHKSMDLETGFDKLTEFLYWMTILVSSTLGTALGDVLAHDTPLGFDGATLLLLVMILIVIALVFFSNISHNILYWLGIVLTHPIGATMGDYMTKPEGLNLGNRTASLYLMLVFVVVIVFGFYFSKHHNDQLERN